jgi:glyoxylase I family protein
MEDQKARKSPPFRPAGLDHLLLLVNDLDAAIGFYEQVAGCALRVRLPQWAMAELDAGLNSLDLLDYQAPEGAWARPAADGGRNIDHFALALATADEAAVRGHLAALGVVVHEERIEDGRLSLYVRDPSGNVVELRLLARP